MTTINSVTLEVEDVAAAQAFYDEAFGLGPVLGLRAGQPPTSGFRAYTMSLVVSQPATVDGFLSTALEAGATEIKPVKRTSGATAAWCVRPMERSGRWRPPPSATAARRPVRSTSFILLLGVDDVGASKAFYVEHGVAVAKSYGRKYVQFDTGPAVTLGLYARQALAKDAGVIETAAARREWSSTATAAHSPTWTASPGRPPRPRWSPPRRRSARITQHAGEPRGHQLTDLAGVRAAGARYLNRPGRPAMELAPGAPHPSARGQHRGTVHPRCARADLQRCAARSRRRPHPSPAPARPVCPGRRAADHRRLGRLIQAGSPRGRPRPAWTPARVR